MQEENLHGNLLFNVFVSIQMTEPKEMSIDQMNTPIDIAVDVHQEKVVITRIRFTKEITLY